VLNFGTAYEVRTSGFNAPAAGKTGSSHDAWFAGYTSNLLCVVWVGYDDYSDIRLSGAELAAPIWAEFMKKAVALPQYRDFKAFQPPSGVVAVKLDKITNYLATPTCPDDYTSAFISGTEPKDTCDAAMSGSRGLLSKILGMGAKPLPPPPVIGASHSAGPGQPQPSTGQPSATAQQQGDQKKKKGLFGKIVGIFKDDKTENDGQARPQPQSDHP
jgi:penicillin-binding protein 1B